MTIPNATITEAIQIIEARIGLSAATLGRIGIGDLLMQLALGEIDRYLKDLRQSDENSPIWQRLIYALTIGETYFLRDKDHYRILRENILPRLILTRRQDDDLELTIWCAGCSTGEEAYSIATTIYEMIPDWNNWRVQLIATDINQRAIEIAQQGIYRDWSFRNTPPSFKQRYFTETDDGWQIVPAIRNMVTFKRMNILNETAIPRADIIFARHILMYLSQEYAQKAENILHDALVKGGWLLLGQAEALRTTRDNWLLHIFPGKPIYQKIDPDKAVSDPITYPTRVNREPVDIEQVVHEHYDKAVEAIHEDKPSQAEYYLSELLDEQPHHAEGHTLLASVFANRQAYPEALSHIHAALEQNGLLANAHYIKALIQMEQDAPDNALQSFSAAIYCDRNHALAAMMLGNIYRNRGDYVKAERNWRNARKAIQALDDEDFVSDISDMTAQRLREIIVQQARVEDI